MGLLHARATNHLNHPRAKYQTIKERSDVLAPVKLFTLANPQAFEHLTDSTPLDTQKLYPAAPTCYYPVPGATPRVALHGSLLSFGAVSDNKFCLSSIQVS